MNEGLDIDALMRQVRSRENLTRAGEEAIAIIKARTLKGVFLEGSSPGAERYSTTPMPLPYSVWTKATQGKVSAIIRKGDEGIRIFTNRKSRLTWVLLEGGYKRFRELAGKESDPVTLNWSGAMMKAIQILSVDEAEGSVTVGFTDYRSGEIAGFHHKGAGRGRKKRIFFELSQAEQDTVKQSALGPVQLQF